MARRLPRSPHESHGLRRLLPSETAPVSCGPGMCPARHSQDFQGYCHQLAHRGILRRDFGNQGGARRMWVLSPMVTLPLLHAGGSAIGLSATDAYGQSLSR
jgi:hypothetical protein